MMMKMIILYYLLQDLVFAGARMNSLSSFFFRGAGAHTGLLTMGTEV